MSSSYPKYSLATSLRYLMRAKETITEGKSYKRKDLLGILGFTEQSGAGQNAITALIHYGFILKDNIDHYFFSGNAQLLAFGGLSDDERHDILSKAFYGVPIFADIANYGLMRDDTHLSDFLKKHTLSSEKYKFVIRVYKKSIDYIHAKTQHIEIPTITLSQPSSTSSHLNDIVTVDMGNAIEIRVTKKLILDAYMQELMKLKEVIS